MAKEMYRVRKSWTNSKSQIGAYSILENAINACKTAGSAYSVYDSTGKTVYPVSSVSTIEVNDKTADPKVIWDYFKGKGFNDFGIAGLMGNLYAESGLRPCNLQNTFEKSLNLTDVTYTQAVDNGSYTNFVKDSAGYGLAQWTYWSRKENLLKFAQEKKVSISDLTMQLDFLYQELTTGYKKVVQTLKTAKSVLEASNAVLLEFERPADQSTAVQNKRAGYGQKYYNDYAEKIISPIEPPVEKGETTMKYSESNKPLVCMMTQSTCYRGSKEMTVKGVLWHSTGANNPTLKRYVQPDDNAANREELIKLIGKNSYGNDWNHIEHQAGLNCWIGKLADGSVTTVQTLPWNYKPWGCGSGPNGSCNNGWVQFEICEDALTDKNYFNTVYKEACEITAYICKMFNLDPKGTATVSGKKVPVILCHADSHKLGMGSNHGDVLHWFTKHGKTMDDVRNDVAELLGKTAAEAPVAPAPATPSNTVKFKVGDEVELVKGAKYTSGNAIPNWVFDVKLYVREARKTGSCVISTKKTGAVTGVVDQSYLRFYDGVDETFTPYLVIINTGVLNVRNGAGTSHKVNTQVRRGEVYTIVGEKDGWGKLKSGAGWIDLSYTQPLKK